MYPVAVYFLDENNNVRAGELLNPYRTDGRGFDIEYVGDHEIDVYVLGNGDDDYIFRTHVSRVSAIREVAYA